MISPTTRVRCDRYLIGLNQCGWTGTGDQLRDDGACPACGHKYNLTPLPAEPARPSWPETWMTIARTIAQRSYDPRLKVGAIVVTSDNTQMLSGGYNGNYAGGPHEHESSEPGQSGFIHAEVNALVKLDFNVMKPKRMYITHSPCRMCAKLIINAGIAQVVYDVAYRDRSGIDLLAEAGVPVCWLTDVIRAAAIKTQP